MQRHLQPAVDRFKGIAEERKAQEFRDKLNGYVKLYAFLSQIMPYADPDLEMLYSFGRFLLPHLPLDRDTGDHQGRRRSGAAVLPAGARLFRARSSSSEGERAGRQEPDRGRHGQGEGRESAAVGDHQGA